MSLSNNVPLRVYAHTTVAGRAACMDSQTLVALLVLATTPQPFFFLNKHDYTSSRSEVSNLTARSNLTKIFVLEFFGPI